MAQRLKHLLAPVSVDSMRNPRRVCNIYLVAAGLNGYAMSGPTASHVGPTPTAAYEIGGAGRTAEPIIMSPADSERPAGIGSAQSRKVELILRRAGPASHDGNHV